MPLDGLTLGFAVREAQCLLGGRIDRVTQPEKDMVVLAVRNENKNYRLLMSASPAMARFHMTDETFTNPAQAPMFCMLLRKYLIGGRIESVAQPNGDRVVCITVNNRDELGEAGPSELWLEVMGRHSNLTLVKNGRIIDCVRHVSGDMSRVRHMLPGLPFTEPPRQDKLAPDTVTAPALLERLEAQTGRLSQALLGAVTGLSPVSARELALRVTGLSDPDLADLDLPETAERVSAFLQKLPALGPAQILTDEAGGRLDFFPFPYVSKPAERQQPCASLNEAMTRFYSVRDRNDRMQQKSASLRHQVKTMLERSEKKLTILEEALRDAADADRYRRYGELLSAQLHLVPKGAREARLPDFYDENQSVAVIPLDESLSPVQNAQRYFKRYRKAMASRKTSAEQKEKCLEDIAALEEALFALDQADTPEDLQDIRAALEAQGLLKAAKTAGRRKKPVVSAPIRLTSSEGLTILVGKNSIQNERLTHDADGDDLWLHAKDMPGSHVILCLNRQPLTQTALLEAARAAAWYSKARGVSVPVDYTFRKYVKKPGGTPAGFVTFTHQKTILVTVTEAEIRPMLTGER